MMQPCWVNLKNKACGQHVRSPPTKGNYAENADAQYIAAAGQWAIDLDSATISYALRVGELASTLLATVAHLETLVSIVGATDISFKGFTFEHATWLRPGQADGYVEQQTGACAVGNHVENHGCTTATDAFWSIKSPGNVVVANSSKITFSACEFARLGGSGLDFSWTQECVVDGCYFHDISGSGIQIGSFNDPLAATLDTNNTVSNTIVNKAAAEFSGAAGINVGYTQGTQLLHNDVSNLTYGVWCLV
jgi:hypothetical protein